MKQSHIVQQMKLNYSYFGAMLASLALDIGLITRHKNGVEKFLHENEGSLLRGVGQTNNVQ
jgi:hypothetical protein